MEMTDKQFQGFICLVMDKMKRALEESPDNKNLQELYCILQEMLGDSD